MAEFTAKVACLCLLVAPLVLLDSGGWGLVSFDSLCLAAGLWALVFQPRQEKGELDLTGISPWLGLALLVGLQLLPLPSSWFAFISPATDRIYAGTIWQVWPGAAMPLSIHPRATLTGLFHLVALAAFVTVVGRSLASWSDLRFVRCCSLCGLLWASMALLATLALFSPWTAILGSPEAITDMRNLLLVWTVSFLPVLAAVYSGLRPAGAGRPRLALRGDYLKLRSVLPHLGAREALLLILVALAASGVPWLWLAGLGSWLTYRGFRAGQWGLRTVCFCLAGLTCLGILQATDFPTMTAVVAETSGAELKTTPTAFPGGGWFGFGLNTQNDLPGVAADLAQRGEAAGGFQLWWGIGITGVLVILLLGCGQLRRHRSGERGAHDRSLLHNLRAAGASGLCWCLFFGGFMSGFAWPGLLTGAAFFLVLATAGAAKPRKTFLATPAWLQRPGRFSVATAVLTTLFCGSLLIGGLLTGSEVLMGRLHAGSETDPARANWRGALDQVETVLAIQTQWLPFESQAPLMLGTLLFEQGQTPKAHKFLLSALRRRPGSADTVFAAALSSAVVGQYENTQGLLRSEVLGGLPSSRLTERLLLAYLSSVAKDPSSVGVIQRVLEWDPDRSARYLGLLVAAGYSLREIFDLLPNRVEAWLAYGATSLALGEHELAEQAYQIALSPQTPQKAFAYLQVADYFRAAGQDAQALVIARTGMEFFPEDFRLRQLAAALHAQMGHARRADAEYMRADLIKSGTNRD